MQDQINSLLKAIVADYRKWTNNSYAQKMGQDYIDERVAEFESKLSVKSGSKYIKIISDSSVWGFIVKGDNDKKFSKGDILKAASWAAPARNKARGNIMLGIYAISWTGPNYL